MRELIQKQIGTLQMPGYEDLRILAFSGPGTIAPTIIKEMGAALSALGAQVRELHHESGRLRLYDVIEEFRPDFLFTPDYLISRATSNKFERFGIVHATWYFDDPLFIGLEAANPRDVFFVTDETWVEPLKKMGAENVFYMPLCTNPEVFKPTDNQMLLEPYRHRVGFLGSTRKSDKFITALKSLDLGDDYESALLGLADVCCENPGVPFEKVVQACCPQFLDFFEMEKTYYLKILLQDYGASLMRMRYIEALGGGVHVYGNDGWKELETAGVNVHGTLDPVMEAPLLYQGCEVNLNFHAGQLRSAVNQRVFDVCACGGFVLSDYRDDLRRLFDFENEIAFFSSRADLESKIKYYTERPEKRIEIIERARERILENHTYPHRAKFVLEALSNLK